MVTDIPVGVLQLAAKKLVNDEEFDAVCKLVHTVIREQLEKKEFHHPTLCPDKDDYSTQCLYCSLLMQDEATLPSEMKVYLRGVASIMILVGSGKIMI